MSNVSGVSSNRDYFSEKRESQKSDPTDPAEEEQRVWNAEFTNKKEKSVEVSDFLNLMVAQLQNQDFMNPVDDTQYVAQMAQFASMQQMQELAEYSKSNYVMSLVGKPVTAARFTVSGDLEKATGTVSKISLVENEYLVYVGDKSFSLEQIMEIHSGDKFNKDDKVDPSNKYIMPTQKTSSTISLEWPVPTDDESAAKKLTYSVYYSREGPFDTVEEVEASGISFGELNRKELTKETLTNLLPDTAYYINVVVTDSDGTKSTYKSLVVRTEKDV